MARCNIGFFVIFETEKHAMEALASLIVDRGTCNGKTLAFEDYKNLGDNDMASIVLRDDVVFAGANRPINEETNSYTETFYGLFYWCGYKIQGVNVACKNNLLVFFSECFYVDENDEMLIPFSEGIDNLRVKIDDLKKQGRLPFDLVGPALSLIGENRVLG